MSEIRSLNPGDLAALLSRIKGAGGAVSMRIDGTARLLGQLQVRGLEPGQAIQFRGAKERDLLPPAGTEVTLSFLLDDEVVTMRTVLLEPLAAGAGGRQRHRVLRAAWPTRPLEVHRREEVRVAAPELPPLGAAIVFQGRRHPAKLMNLTETGMGLGLEQPLPVTPQGEVVVETLLPGGLDLRLVGEVRHYELLDDGPLPVRVGLVLRDLPAEARAFLQRLIQARRAIRSEAIRDHEGN